MLRKKLCLFLVLMLSLSFLVGCSKNQPSDNSTSNDNNIIVDNSSNSNDELTSSDSQSNSNTDSTNNSNSNENIENTEDESSNTESSNDNLELSNIESSIKSKLEEAINTLYNCDYTNEDSKNKSIAYAKENFTEDGYNKIINTLENYTYNFESSDFLITLVKEVSNDNSSFTHTYEVRYDVTITKGKSSIYKDLIAKLVVDNNNNILIESINDNNF